MTQPGKKNPFSPPAKHAHATATEQEAWLLDVGALPGSSHCFINLTTDGQSLRFYGTRERLAQQLSAIGNKIASADLVDGLHLGFGCRVRTIRINDLLLVQRLLPTESNKEE